MSYFILMLDKKIILYQQSSGIKHNFLDILLYTRSCRGLGGVKWILLLTELLAENGLQGAIFGT